MVRTFESVSERSLPSDFFSHTWRRKPLLIRQYLCREFLSDFDSSSFFDWCERSIETVRLFQIDPSTRERYGHSVVLNEHDQVAAIFTRAKNADVPITLHMNKVELVEHKSRLIRDSFEVPFVLRLDDIIATLSTPNSGIGYHAGHEDGFIVQLCGKRRWRVWSSEITSNEYRIAVMDARATPVLRRRSDESCLIDIVLSPGDVLYIPPFFPHEGITLKESLSLAIAWKGIAPISFFKHFRDESALADIKAPVSYDHSVNLFEDFEDLSRIPNYWISETSRSFGIAAIENPQFLAVKRLIETFILLQTEYYFDNEVRSQN